MVVRRISRTFAGTTGTLESARSLIADFVAEQGASTESSEIARLVVSELATNAVEFAPDTNYAVAAERAGEAEQISITVRSMGEPDDVPGHGRFPVNNEGRIAARHRGLAIVHAVSESVSTSANDDGTIDITVVLPLT